MRIAVALFPAAAITLALFCLMQYLITNGHTPVVLPEPVGFVDIVHLEQETDPQASTPAEPAVPVHARVPEASLPAPQVPASASTAPEFPDLSAEPPGLATLDLTRGPYLPSPGKAMVARQQEAVPDLTTSRPRVESATEVLQVEIRPVAPSLPAATGPADALADVGVSGDEAIPVLRIEPDYPRKAARSGEEGWVRIEFTITEHGTVTDPEVVEARPRRVFDRSALAAIRQWQFKPRLDNGKPVSRRASQVIEFRLANR